MAEDQEDLDGVDRLHRADHLFDDRDHPADDLLRCTPQSNIDQFPGGASSSASPSSSSCGAGSGEDCEGDPAPVRRRQADGAEEWSPKKSRRLRKRSFRPVTRCDGRGRRCSWRRRRWNSGRRVGWHYRFGSERGPSASPPPPAKKEADPQAHHHRRQRAAGQVDPAA